jgi:dipeptidyl-peptidase-4
MLKEIVFTLKYHSVKAFYLLRKHDRKGVIMSRLFKLQSSRNFFFALLLVPCTLVAQEKVGYKSLQEAIRATAILSGKAGPRSVNWIDNGDRYSYIAINDSTKREEIRSFDPATGKDELIFSVNGVNFPDTNKQFTYRSFQWAHDSKHILFDLSPIWNF